MNAQDFAETRRWFGLTLQEMAPKLGAEYTALSRIENGRRKPTDSQVRRLAVLRRKMMREMAAKVKGAAE